MNQGYKRIPYFTRQRIKRPNEASVESFDEEELPKVKKRRLKWVYDAVPQISTSCRNSKSTLADKRSTISPLPKSEHFMLIQT